MKRIFKIMIILSILSTISRSFSTVITECPAQAWRDNPRCPNYDERVCEKQFMVECVYEDNNFGNGNAPQCPTRFSSLEQVPPPTSIEDPHLDPWQFCRLQGRVGLKNFGQRTDREPCIHTPLDRHIAEEQLCNFGKEFPDSCKNYPYCCTINQIDIECTKETLRDGTCVIGPLPDYVATDAACSEGARLPIGSQCDS